MLKATYARYGSAAAAAVFAAAFAAAIAADAPRSGSVPPGAAVPDRYVREGIVMEFSAAPAQGSASRELMEG